MKDDLQLESQATDLAEHDFAQRPKCTTRPVDLDDRETVQEWCTRHGISEQRLRNAAKMIGTMPAALTIYFESHGARTKLPIDRMRAIVRSKRRTDPQCGDE